MRIIIETHNFLSLEIKYSLYFEMQMFELKVWPTLLKFSNIIRKPGCIIYGWSNSLVDVRKG